ncbi:[FeFe] hydrogenase H-cluster radical SAM maturase HydG [Clostridium algidicarnis]|uniref:[FeFe] hydrogenase H-cluster radical SAM maturase HydG n=1 Tax=Clostridium algidicarnis TaxID=37659 RepID=UPI001C0E187D|nr:[FeFe] hydrogenase H-cluster radical SAM maturase HydG [Clostridium algidicarnis]MBU3204869.1 [FeFe] hydrogenase H-cluster radical SAM maturase HydG [Clostridium algidicarnis]MBU3213023.1 [FeFe] hydrogenase H-cluster radical SAM maturase HydG [Clostridium algidicarnis]MBU3223680.1 [FeFe] hydrogenase H-cluster radical SAM maturase HydG [Clostridium algidicarnis]
MFIDHEYIETLLNNAKNATNSEIQEVLDKACRKEKLSHEDIAILLQIKDETLLNKMFKVAGDIKKDIYGNRIVIFAPLYISDYCVNNCVYCGYKKCNEFNRRRLTQEEIKNEVMILEKMGHKRLALEAGEDPVNCDIDYITESIKTIYSTQNSNGAIRRINVNIAATTVENYRKLKKAEIGTYILFQETYHKPTYESMHPKCLKGNYEYHLTSFDRAMEAGIDDVGAGVLFGLAPYKFEVLALMIHNAHLEKEFGVGFHTISMPRLKKAEGMDLELFPNLVDDEDFKKIVAILRIAVPFTGLILSTRESAEMRKGAIEYGVTQVSAGSCAGVGGYKDHEEGTKDINQFSIDDNRSPLEILKAIVNHGHIPSYCTACYRSGRVGEKFMSIAKTGEIQNMCQPNAIMTFQEFIEDYGDTELREKGENLIKKELNNVKNEDIKNTLIKNLEKIKNGERDLFF